MRWSNSLLVRTLVAKGEVDAGDGLPQFRLGNIRFVIDKNDFLFLQRALLRLRILEWNRFWGMDDDPTARVSLSAKMDKTNPTGIHIGPYSYVTFRTPILSHNMTRRLRCDARIGANCVIGAHCVILPGVTIGDGSLVAAGSVVIRDVPPNSIVDGNPARVLQSDISTDHYGVLVEPGS